MIGTTFHPFAYIAFSLVGTLIFIVIRSKESVTSLVAAMNTLNVQWIAILVMLIGCEVLLLAKQYNVENSIPASIVGAGIGILTGQKLQQMKEEKKDEPPQS